MSQEAYVPKDGDYGELSFKPIVGKISVTRYGEATIDPEDDRDKWSFDVLEFADPRSDWVFTPKTPPAPPLPTTPGSVVTNGVVRRVLMRGEWVCLAHGDGCSAERFSTADLVHASLPYAVLFDAGAEA